mgnify:FL=1
MAGSNSGIDSQDYRQFKITDQSPSLAVLEAVANFKQKDTTRLATLAENTDPDALNQLVAGTDELILQFEYEGLNIQIVDGELIRIMKPST